MTEDAVIQAAIAFLEQFIARGAAEDVVQTRAALIGDPAARASLMAECGGPEVSHREAFVALRSFLESRSAGSQWAADGQPNLEELARWMAWWSDGDEESGTADPAQWYDWLDAVSTVETPESP